MIFLLTIFFISLSKKESRKDYYFLFFIKGIITKLETSIVSKNATDIVNSGTELRG